MSRGIRSAGAGRLLADRTVRYEEPADRRRWESGRKRPVPDDLVPHVRPVRDHARALALPHELRRLPEWGEPRRQHFGTSARDPRLADYGDTRSDRGVQLLDQALLCGLGREHVPGPPSVVLFVAGRFHRW